MKIFNLVTLILLTATAATQAHLRPAPEEFGIEAEWIYYRPSFDSPYYVIVNDVENEDFLPDGERKANEPHWQSGYRVAAAYTLCDCGPTLRVRWAELCDTRKESEAGSFLLSTKGHPDILETGRVEDQFSGTTDSRLAHHYYSFEAEAAQQVLCCSTFDLFLFAGLQYSRVDLKHDIVYERSEDKAIIKNMSRFWGVGPELGFDFDYDLWCGVRLTGRGSTSLLISKMKAATSQIGIEADTVEATSDARNEKIYRLVPSTNIRLGLTYGCNFQCYGFALEAGYEALSYIKALPSFPFVDNVALGLSLDQYSNADFHGPYVNVSVTF